LDPSGNAPKPFDPETTSRVPRPPAPTPPPALHPLRWLRFLSGPRVGELMRLEPGRAYVFGRTDDADILLAEDLVSRRHARLDLTATPSIEDLGSTNGTFVNGERVTRLDLRRGDRILVGSSIMRLAGDAGAQSHAPPERPPPPRPTRAADSLPPLPGVPTMTGRLEEVPLVDLLQLVATGRKTGALSLRPEPGDAGRITLQAGKVSQVHVPARPWLAPKKALARLLSVSTGGFDFTPLAPGAQEPVDELRESTEMLLLDCLRLNDEWLALESALPPTATPVKVVRPLPVPLRELSPPALDVLQLAHDYGTFGSIIDHAAQPDADAARTLTSLVQAGVLQLG